MTLAVPTFLPSQGPPARSEMAGPAETHPVPGSAAPAPIRDAGQPKAGATWTFPPRPSVDPRPPQPGAQSTWVPRPSGGGGGADKFSEKIAPPRPRGSEKALRRGDRGNPHSASLEGGLSPQLQARIPHRPPQSRATFPTPSCAPSPFRRMAVGTLPLPASYQQRAQSPRPNLSPTVTRHRLGALPPFPVASTCHRPAHAALLPGAGQPPGSHLLPAAHSTHSPIRRLAPISLPAAANSTARVGARAPTRRRRDSVSPSPARRHLGP